MHYEFMMDNTHSYIATAVVIAKSLRCHQIQSQSMYFSNFSWGGMPQTPYIALACFAC